VIFRQFLLHFNQYRFVFLYCKDTNSVLKYYVFVQTLKKMFCFHTYDQVSKIKNHIVFSYNKENFKKYVLACILALITSLLKSRELGQYFKNSKNNLFFFLLISGVMILYVRRVPDIKFSLLALDRLGFTR